MTDTLRARADAFCSRFNLRLPILLAPMAGGVSALAFHRRRQRRRTGIVRRAAAAARRDCRLDRRVRGASNGAVQLNLWIPDPAPLRDPAHEARLRAFPRRLGGRRVPAEAGDATPPDFAAQCEALLAAGPPIVSSVMGLYPADFVARLKARGIAWFANVSTVARGGRRGGRRRRRDRGARHGGGWGIAAASPAAEAERQLIGLFALLPAVVDRVRVPVVRHRRRRRCARRRCGADAGAPARRRSAPASCAARRRSCSLPGQTRLPQPLPEGTIMSRAFSGRAGRSIATDYVCASLGPGMRRLRRLTRWQRGLTQGMRDAGQKAGDVHRMQAWAGQSAALARAEPASALTRRLWDEAQALLR